jgi:hypothetical protein
MMPYFDDKETLSANILERENRSIQRVEEKSLNSEFTIMPECLGPTLSSPRVDSPAAKTLSIVPATLK